MKFKTTILSAIMAGCGLAASAQTFSYNPGDLLMAFRSASGPTNIIVDIGSASIYQNAVGSFTISDVNDALLTSVFGSTEGIYWSVFGGLSSTSSLGADHTIWVTEPRSDALTPTDPRQSSTFNGQGGVVSPINAILGG
ncbi:MAG TPA: hypothetical protein VN516_03030, partial [Candidatus Baltobacteraceae bacterium]|nr:hypothetical protein [Candidatus Baltobacteraceae bacterium]